MQAITKWNGKMNFSSTASSNHEIKMDALPEVGGEDKAIRPKELLLSGLAGCTGMDVISILKKMKIEPQEFRVDVKAELSEDHPKVFTKIHVHYYLKGDIASDKLERAIDLSQNKYCGVSAMYREICPVSYDYKIEN